MKRILFTTLALVLSVSVLPAFADEQNAFVRSDQPHATLRFNGGYQGRRLNGLYLFSIDGQRVFERNRPRIFLKPGEYTLEFRARGVRNRGHVPNAHIAIPGTSHWRETEDTIHATLKAGKVYFIAGKRHGNGAWTAVVWKKTAQD